MCLGFLPGTASGILGGINPAHGRRKLLYAYAEATVAEDHR